MSIKFKRTKKNHTKIKIIYFEHHYDDMILKNYTFSDIHDCLKVMDLK